MIVRRSQHKRLLNAAYRIGGRLSKRRQMLPTQSVVDLPISASRKAKPANEFSKTAERIQ